MDSIEVNSCRFFWVKGGVFGLIYQYCAHAFGEITAGANIAPQGFFALQCLDDVFFLRMGFKKLVGSDHGSRTCRRKVFSGILRKLLDRKSVV